MIIRFRDGFTAGALLAFAVGIYLVWLWRPDHQVQLHTAHLLQKIERRDWSGIESAVSQDYADNWGDDRERLLARMREVLRFTRKMKIHCIAPIVSAEGRKGSWIGRIEIEGDNSEVMAEIMQRINSLSAPFELQWTRQSAKFWDWKLTRVHNRELVL